MNPLAKPHRFLLDRVGSYREEARAFADRRRIRGLPFVRARYRGGATAGFEVDSDPGRTVIAQTDALLAELEALRR